MRGMVGATDRVDRSAARATDHVDRSVAGALRPCDIRPGWLCSDRMRGRAGNRSVVDPQFGPPSWGHSSRLFSGARPRPHGFSGCDRVRRESTILDSGGRRHDRVRDQHGHPLRRSLHGSGETFYSADGSGSLCCGVGLDGRQRAPCGGRAAIPCRYFVGAACSRWCGAPHPHDPRRRCADQNLPVGNRLPVLIR